MASIKFNILVISTYEGEILDVLVGTDTGLLTQLKETQYWDDMIEESSDRKSNIDNFDIQNLSDYYKANQYNNFLSTRVTYIPNKVVFSK